MQNPPRSAPFPGCPSIIPAPFVPSRRRFCTIAAALIAGVGGSHLLPPNIAAAASWDDLPVSPLVHKNGRITFLFPSGKFQSVVLNLGGVAPTPLARQSDGSWMVTIPPLPPEIYTYSFSVNGVMVLDPFNPWVKKNLFHSQSMLLVPGHPPSPWQNTDVPHGVVARHVYHSAVAGDNRAYYVYTPPGYHASANHQYPTLFLLHGYSDEPGAWSKVGRVNFILDNLIHAGKVKPMVVVMPNGYGDPAIAARNSRALADRKLWLTNLKDFQASLLHEVMPRVQQEYRLAPGRDNTAIAGLSMGGGEALITGLNHLKTFAWIGGFSSYVGNHGADFSPFFPKLSAADNARIRLLWVSCGRQDPLVGKANRQLDHWLVSKNVKFRSVWTPGMHQWRVWRNNFVHFAPLLFS